LFFISSLKTSFRRCA